MDTEDGKVFIKQLAHFVRTHEKALANALQLQKRAPRNAPSPASPTGVSGSSGSSTSTSTTNAIAAALSLPSLTFGSQAIKPVKLTLTPHHLFYLLSRFEELAIPVGPMNVRLEHITDAQPSNYVSFLGKAPKSRGRSDADSIHSVSSVRSALSSMSSMWSKFTLSNEDTKLERQKHMEKEDMKYLYSAFTKVPCLRLSPDRRSKLIAGYEEFPFDTAVPLFAFKNLSALEICDLDFRQMYGWDRLAEQVRSLTLKRAGVEDVADVLTHIVLDDMDKRRRRSAKHAAPPSPATQWQAPSPTSVRQPDHPSLALNDLRRPSIGSPPPAPVARKPSTDAKKAVRPGTRQRSQSPVRPTSARHNTYTQPRAATPKFRRSSGSDSSSPHSTPRNSSSNLLSLNMLPSTKWRFLRHLSLADNGLTFMLAPSLAPLATSLYSLDLSSNLFIEIPDSLATLTNLRALNLSNCMISSLHSLARNPLPAITVLNLHSNRLTSLAGIERLPSLEKVDLRANRLTDPTELARLTRIPDMQQLYVHRNPFIRTHSNYRTTIFNLFRKSQGYMEDVIIDSTGPTYSERKHLVERAYENPPLPPPKQPEPHNMPPPAVRQSSPSKHRDGTPPPAHGSESMGADTLARKKAPRRRIVELSQSNPSSPEVRKDSSATTEAVSPSRTITSSQKQTSSTASRQDLPRLPPLETGRASPSPTRSTPDLITDEESPLKEADEMNAASDVYRQKIEALKSDLGSRWLTALHEDSWDKKAAGHEHSSGYESVHRNHSPLSGERSVSVGRTLG